MLRDNGIKNRIKNREEYGSSESRVLAGCEELQDWLVLQPKWVIDAHQMNNCPSFMN
jgi:hypothetical protein